MPAYRPQVSLTFTGPQLRRPSVGAPSVRLPVSSRAALAARDLRVIDERLDAQVGAIAAEFRRDMERQLAGWFKDAVEDIARDVTEAGKISTSARSQARAGRVAGTWLTRMSPVRDRMLVLFRRAPESLTPLVVEGLRKVGRTPTSNTQALMGFYSLKRDELSGTLERVATQSAVILRKAALSGQMLSEVLVEIREVVEAAAPILERQIDTALMELAQLMVLMSAQPGDVFLYSGPIDWRIRPFCLKHVGRVYARGTIDQMDNGQLPNTFLTRGGYRCRHLWRPVTDPTLKELADTDQVVRSSWLTEIRSVGKLQHRPGTS